MVIDKLSSQLLVDDIDSPSRAALYEQGALVEYFTERDQEKLRLGAIIAVRISRVFARQNRAECKLPEGQIASFRLGGGVKLKAGDMAVITLSAAPRQHKPWQAEQGISRAGRHVILHYGQEGVRASYKVKTQAAALSDEINTAIGNALNNEKGQSWGCVLKRACLERLHAGKDMLALILDEIKALLDPLDKAALASASKLAEPTILYQGDDLLLAGRLASISPPSIQIEADMLIWDDITDKITKATAEQYVLDSGIMLTTQMTQALTAIDIDSATSQLGPRDVARQSARPVMQLIRLARLSGIVLVDMPRLPVGDRDAVLAVMREEASCDRRHPDILGFSRAGLIEIVIRHHYAPHPKTSANH